MFTYSGVERCRRNLLNRQFPKEMNEIQKIAHSRADLDLNWMEKRLGVLQNVCLNTPEKFLLKEIAPERDSLSLRSKR
jgi:hypothetical protein